MKKVLSLIVCLALLVGCFAGCGGGTSSQSSSASDSSSASTEDSGSGDESQAEDFSGTITINTQAGLGATEAWQAVADAYMEMHPNVNVVVDLKAAEGYAEWIKAMFASENPETDLVNINMAGPDAGDKAINYMEYAYNDSPYSDGPWNEQFEFRVQGANLATNYWNALSLESVQVLWFYNQDIFDEVGITTTPSTWDEFVAICEQLDAAGYQPLSVAGDFNSFWAGAMGWLAQIYVDQTTRSMINTYRAQEGDYCYDPDIDANWEYDPTDPWNDDTWVVTTNTTRAWKAVYEGEYRADTPGMKTVWTNFAKIFPKYAGGDAFFGTTSATELFYQGKAAIMVDGAWRLANFKQDMEKLAAGEDITVGENAVEGVKPFNLGHFNMPSMEGEGIEAPARTLEVAVGFIGAVKKDKAHDDMVMDFLMYYSSAEGFGKYWAAGMDAGMVPNGMSYVYGVELPEEYATLFDGLTPIGNCQKGCGQMLARGIGDVQEALRDWYGISQEFLEGKITVDEWATQNQEIQMSHIETAMGDGVSIEDLEHPENEPAGKE
mgnify:FL=1